MFSKNCLNGKRWSSCIFCCELNSVDHAVLATLLNISVTVYPTTQSEGGRTIVSTPQ